jgi:cytoskeletal protein CcmA (bactofilin family)
VSSSDELEAALNAGASPTIPAGSIIVAENSLEVASGKTLTVAPGAKLTVEDTLTVPATSSLEVKGTVVVKDNAPIYGTLKLDGGTLELAENAIVTFDSTSSIGGTGGTVEVKDGATIKDNSGLLGNNFWANDNSAIVYKPGAEAFISNIKLLGAKSDADATVQLEEGTVTQTKGKFTLDSTGVATVAKVFNLQADAELVVNGNMTVTGTINTYGKVTVGDGGTLTVTGSITGTSAVLVISDGGTLDVTATAATLFSGFTSAPTETAATTDTPAYLTYTHSTKGTLNFVSGAQVIREAGKTTAMNYGIPANSGWEWTENAGVYTLEYTPIP